MNTESTPSPASCSLGECVAALVLIGLGCIVVFGWLLQQPAWVQLRSNYFGMTFNAALCFILLGTAILTPQSDVRRGLTLLAGTLAAAVFTQYVLGIDLHVDRWVDARWLHDGNPYPGRMAPQAAVCFVLATVGLWLSESRRPSELWSAHVLILLIGLAALLSIVGYLLQLELLYSWHRYTRMAPHTALGFTVLALALWLRWYRLAGRQGAFVEAEERRINVIGTAIIVLTGTSAGAMGFVLLAHEAEQLGIAALTRGLEDRAQVLRTVLDQREATARGLARDAHWQTLPQAQLAAHLEDALRDPITALAVLANDGTEVAATERALPMSTSSIALDAHSTVYWQAQASRERLFMETRLRVGPQRTLLVRQDLSAWQQVIAGSDRLSPSADLQICAALATSQMRCLPTRLRPAGIAAAPRAVSAGKLPIDLALAGERGQLMFVGPQGRRATGAYAPLRGTSLGLVLQQDSEELYAPVRSKLPKLLLLLAAMLACGVALLRSQLAPLIRALVQARAAAAMNAYRVATIMDNVPDGIITSDVHGSIVSVNPAVCRLFGYQQAQLLGTDVRRLFPERVRVHDAGVQRMVGRGPIEVIACRSDGSEFPMELTLNTMDMAGTQFFVGIMHDITQRREVERLKSEFVSVVSHELRTPLTSIRGSLGLLVGGTLRASERQAQYLIEIAYRNSISLSALIDDILDVEKAEIGRMALHCQAQPLGPLLVQAIDTNVGYAQQFQVQLLLRDAAPGVHVNVDGARLLQVLANLLSNASKFSPPNSVVTLSATLCSPQVRIAVQDAGPGIAEGFKPRIFEKFSQADSSDRRKKGGTGLGLAISRAIVQAMGGTIGFESPPQGGALFFVELPTAAAAALNPVVSATLDI